MESIGIKALASLTQTYALTIDQRPVIIPTRLPEENLHLVMLRIIQDCKFFLFGFSNFVSITLFPSLITNPGSTHRQSEPERLSRLLTRNSDKTSMESRFMKEHLLSSLHLFMTHSV